MAKTFEPRPKQREVLAYRGGYLGVAAVPGSGKNRDLELFGGEAAAGD